MDFREIVPAVASANPGGIIVVAIGSGTILDTSRFRMLLAEHSDGIDDVYLSVPTVLGRGGSSGRRSPELDPGQALRRPRRRLPPRAGPRSPA